MTIDANVFLFAPPNRTWVGGTNYSLARKTVGIEITPPVLERALNERTFQVADMRCVVSEKYSAANNTIGLHGDLPDEGTIEKIKALETDGWIFDRKKCDAYGIAW